MNENFIIGTIAAGATMLGNAITLWIYHNKQFHKKEDEIKVLSDGQIQIKAEFGFIKITLDELRQTMKEVSNGFAKIPKDYVSLKQCENYRGVEKK